MKHVQEGGASIAAVEVRRERAAPWGLVGLASAMLSGSLGTSIVNVALPKLAATFGAPFEAVQWIVIAYLLTSTAVIVVVGRLGDAVGVRRLLLGGLLSFGTASVACGLAPSLPVLIALRAVQGIGAAVLMALTVALARSVVGKERTGSAMGLLGTMSAIGTALGPSLGGAMLATLGWRAVFFANVPLTLLSFALTWRHLPPDRERVAATPERFDRAGAALLAATLASFAFAATARDGGAWRLVSGIVALVGAVAFVAVEKRAASPLLPLSLLRDRGLGGALITNTVVSTVMMATLVVGPFHLVHALGLDAGRAGLVMSIGPAVSALIGVPAGRLVDRVGVRRVTIAGLLGVVVGTGAVAALAGHTTVLSYVAPLAVTTGSYALFSAANNTAVMADASAARRGMLSGLLSLSRNLGLMTGATVLGSVFAVACGTIDVAEAPRDVIAAALRTTFTAASSLVGAVALFAALRGNREVSS
ncbi:MAG: MFS transporter [Planctomycetes bacterium]|nr:MFS transporter [Planctomycetota bacterium]